MNEQPRAVSVWGAPTPVASTEETSAIHWLTRGATTGRQVTSGIIPPEIALGTSKGAPAQLFAKSQIQNLKSVDQ